MGDQFVRLARLLGSRATDHARAWSTSSARRAPSTSSGLGTIRDAFADRLFPGTSTLQSRTRYWLFIPWLYQRLEGAKVRSADADGRIRQLQAELVRSLEKGGESEGVIGIERKEKVLRPPSFVYWAGLARYGILLFPGSIGRYHVVAGLPTTDPEVIAAPRATSRS